MTYQNSTVFSTLHKQTRLNDGGSRSINDYSPRCGYLANGTINTTRPCMHPPVLNWQLMATWAIDGKVAMKRMKK